MNNNFGQSGYGPQESDAKYLKYPTTTKTFYGSSAEVNYSSSVFANYGWDTKVTEGNPCVLVATLNMEAGGSNGITPVTSSTTVTVNWSYHFNPSEKNLLECSTKEISWIKQINDNDFTVIKGLLDNTPKDGNVNFTANSQSCEDHGTWSSASLSVSSSKVVWDMTQTGQKTQTVYQPVLRKSMTVPSGYDMSGIYSNVGRFYSVSSLTSAIGIPTNWAAIMPQGSDPSSSDTRGITYYYGWLKQSPTADQNGNVITINQEYVYGLYPSNIKGARL